MALNDLISSFGLMGAGSLITVIITHFLEKGKLKTERQSNLQREIYFNLQEQAEKLFEEISLWDRQFEEIESWMEEKIFMPILTNTPITERISKTSSLQVYFSKDILSKFDETALVFKEIVKIYFETGEIGNVSQDNCDKLNVLSKKFKEGISELAGDILKELERNKKLII